MIHIFIFLVPYCNYIPGISGKQFPQLKDKIIWYWIWISTFRVELHLDDILGVLIAVAVFRYLIFYGFCIPLWQLKTEAFSHIIKNCTLLRQYLKNIAASITQVCYEDLKSTICIALKKKIVRRRHLFVIVI